MSEYSNNGPHGLRDTGDTPELGPQHLSVAMEDAGLQATHLRQDRDRSEHIMGGGTPRGFFSTGTDLEETIGEHPWTAVTVALLAGVGIGLLLVEGGRRGGR